MAEKKKTTKKATTKKTSTKKAIVKEEPKKVEETVLEKELKIIEEPLLEVQEEPKAEETIDKVVDIVNVKEPEIKENVSIGKNDEKMNTISAENVVKEINNRRIVSFRRDFGYTWNGMQVDY